MLDNNAAMELEDVFDALVGSERSADGDVLARWVRQYPQFERELIDFLASWSLMDSAAAPDCLTTDRVHETLVLRAMSTVQNILHDKSRTPEPPPMVDGLLRNAHKTLADLALLTQLGEVVLRKLDRRLIRFATIPEEAVSVVAAALAIPVAAVTSYLKGPPSFASNALYHSSEAPTLAKAEDFATAVRSDPTMTEADRARWLSGGRLQ